MARKKSVDNKVSVENDPQASPATILACIQLFALLVRLALAFWKSHEPEAGRAHAAELLSRRWVDPLPLQKSWRERIKPEDRMAWDYQGPRWRALRILEALGQEVPPN